MRILGIDPGYDRMGVAVIEKINGKEVVLHSNCFSSNKTDPFAERLRSLGAQVEEVIKQWQPGGMALEKLFFENNQKTATSIAEVRGMLLYISGIHQLSLFEYTPLQIKVAIAGHGKADKKQVEAMVHALVKLPDTKRLDDEYDAIAIALTCLAYNQRL